MKHLQRIITLAVVIWMLPTLANAAGEIVLPSGAATDCGSNGARFVIKREVPLRDVNSGRTRYGPCFGGNTAAGCSDLGGRCITTEAERQQIIQYVIFKQLGCDPEGRARTVRFPSEQEIEDAGLAVGLAAKLHQEFVAACVSRPDEPQGCPTGTSCQAPCQPCPTGTSCQRPCPPCTGPGGFYTADKMPLDGVLVDFWDRVAKMEHRGTRVNGSWVTLGGVFTDAQVYFWREVGPAPAVK